MNKNSKLHNGLKYFINISAIIGLGSILYALIFTAAYYLDIAQQFFMDYPLLIKLGVFTIAAFIIRPITDKLFIDVNNITKQQEEGL